MTEPWPSFPPEMNAVRMEAGTGPATYMAAAGAFTALAANFEVQQGVLLAHQGGIDALWPGLTVAARQGKIAAYSGWLQSMVAECMRLSTACVVVAEAYTTARAGQIPSQVAIQNRVDQAVAVATNFFGINQPLITFLDTTYVEHWTQNAEQMSVYDATVIAASLPVPKAPPPPLVNPAEPALEAAQQAVTNMAQSNPSSVANQQSMDPSQMMQPLQQLMSAPGQLMQPFQQAMSAPQQMMQSLMSSMNGMGGSGSEGSGGYSPFAASLGGGSGSAGGMGSGAGAGGAMGSGGVGGLRPALSSSASLSGGVTAMSNNQSLSPAGAKTSIPGASSAMPGGMGGLGGGGMRGKEDGTREYSTIEAGVAPIADTDTVRANDILAQWLPKRSGRID